MRSMDIRLTCMCTFLSIDHLSNKVFLQIHLDKQLSNVQNTGVSCRIYIDKFFFIFKFLIGK